MIPILEKHKRLIEKETTLEMGKNEEMNYNPDFKYDFDFEVVEHERQLARVLACCPENITSFKVLDCGCGFGELALVISERVKRVIGIEPNTGYLRVANLKKEIYGRNNVSFVEGVGERLPFASESFDLVISNTVLEHVQNVERTVSEMVRVVKKGGLVYVECPNYFWIKEGHYNVLMPPLFPKWLFKLYLRLRGRDVSYLDKINYTTSWNLFKQLKLLNVKVTSISKRLLLEKLGVLGYLFYHLHFYPMIVLVGEKQ